MAKNTLKHTVKVTPAKASKKSVKNKKTKIKTLNFDYIKSNQFRVVHADGVHGGVCPKGRSIQIAFFNERQPIPKRETYNLDGMKLAGLKKSDVRDAIIREVEVEVLLDLDTATSLYKWLGDKIESAIKIEREGKKK